jgi:hypothetical protein
MAARATGGERPAWSRTAGRNSRLHLISTAMAYRDHIHALTVRQVLASAPGMPGPRADGRDDRYDDDGQWHERHSRALVTGPRLKGGRPMPAICRVIAGVSGSQRGLPALRYAAALAHDYSATLIPVLTWLPPGSEFAYCKCPSGQLRPVWEQDARERLRAALTTALGGLPGAGRPAFTTGTGSQARLGVPAPRAESRRADRAGQRRLPTLIIRSRLRLATRSMRGSPWLCMHWS